MIYNFKSNPEFYEKELRGLKPNTVRLIGSKDNRKKIHEGDTIRIRNANDENETFEREVTDVSVVGEILGKDLIVISWSD